MLTALSKYGYIISFLSVAFFLLFSFALKNIINKASSTFMSKFYLIFQLVICLFCPQSQMIKSKVGNIKSGWRSVFMIFTAAADDDMEAIVDSAFENVEQGKTYASSCC